MSKFVEVARINEIKDGTAKEVMVQGHEILLAKVGDKYYATDNRCPHMGGKLSQGKLEGTVVTCPLHGSQLETRSPAKANLGAICPSHNSLNCVGQSFNSVLFLFT